MQFEQDLHCSLRHFFFWIFRVISVYVLRSEDLNRNIVLVNFISLALQAPKTKILDFAHSIDPDEVVHHETPDLDVQYSAKSESSFLKSH